MDNLGINLDLWRISMTTETKPKKSYFSRKKPEKPQKEKPATAEAQAQPQERKYEPNPATEEVRELINETGRAAAYAAQALVPNDARNRPGQVAKVRAELQRDAVGDLIAQGRIKLPERPAASHAERSSRQEQLELS